MRILLLILLSTFAWGDNHDEMYTNVIAEYTYCSVKDGLDDADAEKMFGENVQAYLELANSFENDVGIVALWPYYANEEMTGGHDMMFVAHAPSRKAKGAFNDKMFQLMSADDNFPESPMECESSEAFQRVGPSSSDELYDAFVVDYWPCKYIEGADPVAMREAQAKFSMEHYANGAEGGFRYIYPGAGSDRGETPDFWVSAASPSLEARGANNDIFWEKSYGSETERERWNHMTCDTPSTWVGWRLK